MPSPLQLAPGTVLLLDETAMAPGQLSERGVASMQVGGGRRTGDVGGAANGVHALVAL